MSATIPVLGVCTVFCFTNPFVAASVSQLYISAISFETDVVVKAYVGTGSSASNLLVPDVKLVLSVDDNVNLLLFCTM